MEYFLHPDSLWLWGTPLVPAERNELVCMYKVLGECLELMFTNG